MTTPLARALEILELPEGQSLLVLMGDPAPLRLDPRLPTLVSLPLAETGRAALLDRYPATWEVAQVQTADGRVAWGPLSACAGSLAESPEGFLYLPPLPWQEDLKDFRTLMEVIARLRAPDGCPWDRAQTHRSIAPYLLEETYEALEALDTGAAALQEELGDILLQVALHSQIAVEEGAFAIGDVVGGLAAKLIRRHPHVFGEATAKTAAEVAARWEVLKSQERDGASLLAGVPRALPALGYAQRVQERAGTVGFDWTSVNGVLEKVAEEATELAQAATPADREAEMGDLLFSLVNLGRWLGLDVEAALRQANARFVRRFQTIEELSRRRGL
ncbi:MAG: nucleoside triphosphate pyrophosphohydrolase, partial [Chloroflexi bacterium]|nr:nucleoside triphosphate pyrophosphohydrolase [Chloroflexota bacterium]